MKTFSKFFSLAIVMLLGVSRASFACEYFGFPSTPLTSREFEPVSFDVSVGYIISGDVRVDSIATSGNVITVKVAAFGPASSDCFSPPPIPTPGLQVLRVTLLPKSLGTYIVRPMGSVELSRTNFLETTLIVSASAPRVKVTAFTYTPSKRYFITALQSEVDALEAINKDKGYQAVTWRLYARSDEGFFVWLATGDAPTTAKPVCRFYHPVVSTHFYSASQSECDLLKSTAPWIDEGLAFRAILPENGSCMEGTDPVYRLFSAELSNHRYTRERDTIIAMAANGWKNEGPAFCSPKN